MCVRRYTTCPSCVCAPSYGRPSQVVPVGYVLLAWQEVVIVCFLVVPVRVGEHIRLAVYSVKLPRPPLAAPLACVEGLWCAVLREVDGAITTVRVLRVAEVCDDVQQGLSSKVLVPAGVPSPLSDAAPVADACEVHAVPLPACGCPPKAVVWNRNTRAVRFALLWNVMTRVARCMDAAYLRRVVERSCDACCPLQLYP